MTLAVAVGASSALSFGFHAVTSRLLTPTDYSGLAALLAVMVACAVPVGAAQAAVTRAVAHQRSLGEDVSGRRALQRALVTGCGFVVLGVLAAPLVSGLLQLDALVPAAFMGVWLGVTTPNSVLKALLIGSGRLRPVGLGIVAGAALRIVAAGAFAAWAGLGPAMVATVIGEAACALALGTVAARSGLLRRDGSQVRATWLDASRAFNVQLALWSFAALAVVTARHALPTESVGAFAAMATAAGACIFLPQAVATAAFPRFVSDGSSRLLLQAAALALGVGAACAAVLSASPTLVFRLLFGPGYVPDRLTLALLCLHFCSLGCLTVVAQYLVARRHAGTGLMWIAVAVAAVGTFTVHTPRALAIALAVPSVVTTVAFLTRAVATYRTFTPARWRVAGDRVGEDVVSGAMPAFLARTSTDAAPSGRTKVASTGLVADEVDVIDVRGEATTPAAGEAGPDVIAGHTEIASSFATVLARDPRHQLTVVVPSYNGGTQLRDCVADLCATLDRERIDYELVVSIDGSSDGSDALVEGVHPRVRVVRAPRNQGKGAALRRGFSVATGEVVSFIDGDGDIDPAVLVALYRQLETSRAWLAVASKNVPGAEVEATSLRKVMSAVYRIGVHWMFDLEVSDTQCGAKAFRRRYLAAVLDHTRETGFALDLELLAVGRRLGMGHAVEVPVVLRRGELGTISRRSVVRMIRDTVGVYRRLPRRTWGELPLPTPMVIGGEQFGSPLLP